MLNFIINSEILTLFKYGLPRFPLCVPLGTKARNDSFFVPSLLVSGTKIRRWLTNQSKIMKIYLKIKILAKKIEPKIYEFGFLKK